jgi:hypothetical protein
LSRVEEQRLELLDFGQISPRWTLRARAAGRIERSILPAFLILEKNDEFMDGIAE